MSLFLMQFCLFISIRLESNRFTINFIKMFSQNIKSFINILWCNWRFNSWIFYL